MEARLGQCKGRHTKEREITAALNTINSHTTLLRINLYAHLYMHSAFHQGSCSLYMEVGSGTGIWNQTKDLGH